jgi:hypothetical protein
MRPPKETKMRQIIHLAIVATLLGAGVQVASAECSTIYVNGKPVTVCKPQQQSCTGPFCPRQPTR